MSEELEDLKAQLAAAKAARDSAEAAAKPSDKETLLREIADETAMAEALSKYGAIGKEIHGIYTTEGVIIIKRPRQAEFRLYQQAGTEPAERHQAMDILVRSCLAHPDKETYSRIEDRLPMITSLLAGAAAILAGSAMKSIAEK